MRYVYFSFGCFLLFFVPPRLPPSFPALGNILHHAVAMILSLFLLSFRLSFSPFPLPSTAYTFSQLFWATDNLTSSFLWSYLIKGRSVWLIIFLICFTAQLVSYDIRKYLSFVGKKKGPYSCLMNVKAVRGQRKVNFIHYYKLILIIKFDLLNFGGNYHTSSHRPNHCWYFNPFSSTFVITSCR